MEPTLPAPHGPQGTPEAAGQRSPEKPLRLSREQAVEQPVEQPSPERPAQQEQQPSSQAASGTPPPMPVVPLPNDQPTTQQPQDDVPTDDAPLVAADEDLIEKEWVDKAKKIITDTKHDPYEQERAVSRLQAQYLKKRYGKELTMPQGE